MSIFDTEHNSAIQEALNGNTDTALTGAIVSATKADEESSTASDTIVDYYFDTIINHSIELNNQITDNWIENNSAIHDHIAQEPITISLSGLVSENVFVYSATEANELLQKARLYAAKQGMLSSSGFWDYFDNISPTEKVDKLAALPLLYPPLANYMQLAINQYELAKSSIDRFKNIKDTWKKNKSITNNQPFSLPLDTNIRVQEVFFEFDWLRRNNKALTVTTPWGVFSNMYIQSVSLSQANQNFITDVQLTLKQINFAEVTTTSADKNVMAQYNAYQRAQVENNGTAQGTKKSISAQIYDKNIKS